MRGFPNIDLLVVDSVTSLVAGEMNLDEETVTAVGQLKGLALDRDTAILTTVPLPVLAARGRYRAADQKEPQWQRVTSICPSMPNSCGSKTCLTPTARQE